MLTSRLAGQKQYLVVADGQKPRLVFSWTFYVFPFLQQKLKLNCLYSLKKWINIIRAYTL